MLKEIFSKRLNTQSKTVCNAIITLGDIDDSGKGKRFKSRFIQPGLAGYPGQFGSVLVRKETIDNSLNTIIGAPVIINHKDITKDNADDERVGVISNAYYNEKDGWYWCDGVIWDETAQNLITDKKWSVSCSYDFLEEDDAGGSENNIPYDREFTKLNFVHLAIVDNPRYERANIVFNSKTVVQNYNPNQKRDEQGRWTKEDYNAQIDKIISGELKSADRIKVSEHPSTPWLNSGLQDAEIVMSTSTYHKATKDKHKVSEETMRNLPDLISNPQYIFKSSTVPGSYVGVLDDYEDENGVKKPLVTVVKPEQDKINVNIIPSVYGKDENFIYREAFKDNLLYEKPQKNKTVSNNIVASIATETLKPSTDIITDIQEDFNPNLQNIKEHEEMTLLEELKKLITKVENDKGENMDDKKEKIDNEKIDKRKLIDEIGGMLKGKVDEELWRTIIGKAEKLSYEKSEAGTSDNEKEDVDNKKIKNETKEDQEKYEELKEEVKKDTENKKCNNSVDNSKSGFFDKLNEVYNSSMEPPKQNVYVSRAERLKAAEEYFS